MNKKLVAAAVMAALTVSTASVFAAAPAFSGDAQLLTQKDRNGSTFSNVRLRLNADADLGDGVYAHGRLMGIDMSPDYGTAGTGSKGATVNMEQMYLGAKLGAVDVKVGRQPLYIGQQGLLADINGIEGVSLSTEATGLTANGFVGRSNETGIRDTVAFNLGTKLDGVNLGVGYLKTSDDDQNKYWSFSGSTKVTNSVGLAAEYVKNDAKNADGFIVKATFGELAQKGDINYDISYRNIENNAVDANWVTNGAYADSKGIRVGVNYKATNNGTLYLYQDITKKQSDSTVKPNQFRAEFDINF